MAPKSLSSNALISASSAAHEKKGKRLKRSVGANLDSETQDLKDETVNVDKMTVQELRAALRDTGLSAKGSKRDLVSTLKSYLDKKIDGELLEMEQQSSLSADSLSALKKAKLSDGEHSVSVDMTTVEASTFRQTKSTIKQSNFVANIETVDVGIVTEKTRVRNHGISARKQSSRSDNSRFDILANENEPWTIFAHKKPQKGWIAYNPKTMRPPPLTADTKSVRLMSWNVNGLRALLKLEGFSALQLAKRENFDVLCLQETKLQEKDIQSVADSLMLEYPNCFWACSISKLGYSGTAIISRIKPLSVRYGLGIEDHDGEGRIITAEFDTFYLMSAYVPNSGDGLRRLTYRTTEWDTSLSNHMKELEKSKPVILTGDLNCAHEEIDIYNPAGNKRSAGFTIEERQSFETNFLSRGFVDTFRKQHPGVVGYTYWGYRHGGRKTNKGWRLDYFLVSESMAEKVHDSYIIPDVTGSDHCPIGLVLRL